MMNNKIVLAFDFRFIQDEPGFGEMRSEIIEYTGDYTKNIEKIKKILLIPTIEEILKILSWFKNINFKDLEKIIGITHAAMWEHIDNLEKLKLVTREKIKIEKMKKELKINLHPDVNFSQLNIFEYSKMDKKDNDFIYKISASNRDALKQFGVLGKPLINEKNIGKIIENYINKINKKLNTS